MLLRHQQPIRWMWKHIPNMTLSLTHHTSALPLHSTSRHHSHRPRITRFAMSFSSTTSTQPSAAASVSPAQPPSSSSSSPAASSSSSPSSGTPLNPGAQAQADGAVNTATATLAETEQAAEAARAPAAPAPPNTSAIYQENAATLTATPTAAGATNAAPAAAPTSAASSSNQPSSVSQSSPGAAASTPAPGPASTEDLLPHAAVSAASPGHPSPPAPSPPASSSSPVSAAAAASVPRTAHPGFLVSDQQVFLSDGRQVSINELLRDRRVLLLGFVAAYTRLCQQSLLAYSAQLSTLKKKYGIDGIVAIAVNDHSVLSSFSSSLSLPSAPALSLVADFDARVTRWLGMEVDLSVVGFGLRCKRFAMLVDRQQVRVVRVEGNVGVLDVTSVDSMIAVLKEMKAEEGKREKEALTRDRPAGDRDERKDREGGSPGLGAGGGGGLAVGAATAAADVQQQQQSAQSEEELEEEKRVVPELLH